MATDKISSFYAGAASALHKTILATSGGLLTGNPILEISRRVEANAPRAKNGHDPKEDLKVKIILPEA